MTALIREARLLKQPWVLSFGGKESAPASQQVKTLAAKAEKPVAGQPSQQGAWLNSPPVKHESPVTPGHPSTRVWQHDDEGHAHAAIMESQEREEILKRETELARQEAKEQGQREGYSAGLARGESEYQEKLSSLRAVIEAAASALDQGIRGIEDAAVEIAFEATCKILGTALMDRAGVMAVVKRVISYSREKEKLIIRVSPGDYAMLNGSQAGLVACADLPGCEFVADERVTLGGCLLEASGGNLDGRLEIQLHQFHEVLLSTRGKPAEDGIV